MNERPTDIADLCELLCEGALDAAGASALEQLVVNDAEARRHYIRHTHLHTALYRAVDPASAVTPTLADTSDTPPPIARLGWIAAIAAVIFAALGVWAYLNPTPAPPVELPHIVATVVDGSAVLTDVNGDLVQTGADVAAGGYEIGDGAVQLLTRRGATATFRGPGRFTLSASHRIALGHGLVVVDVPDGATSLNVAAGDYIFRDIGTRFAVSTDGTEADVHVYEGAVEMRTGGRSIRTLRAGEAGRTTASGIIGIDTVAADTLLAGTWTLDQELTNADFEFSASTDERGLAGWTTFGVAEPDDPNVLRAGEPIVTPHDGTYAAKVFGRFDPAHVYSGLYQQVPVEPGERCVGSVYVAHKSTDALAGDNAAWCKFDFVDEVGEVIASVDSSGRLTADSPVDTYEKLDVEALAPAGAAAVRFVLIVEQDKLQSRGAALFDSAALRIDTQPLSSHTEIP